nr:hypothetical protein [Tanacetum cinerariifolium]
SGIGVGVEANINYTQIPASARRKKTKQKTSNVFILKTCASSRIFIRVSRDRFLKQKAPNILSMEILSPDQYREEQKRSSSSCGGVLASFGCSDIVLKGRF